MADMPTQYRIIASGAGWVGRPERGHLRFDGADRLSFLQALLSNDVAVLEKGLGAYAVYLTPQGRMISDLRVFHRGDFLIAEVPAHLAPRLAERFDSVIFAEDVQVRDVTGSTAEISVIGGGAAGVVARALALDIDVLRGLPVFGQLDVPQGDTFVVRGDDARLDCFDVVMPVEARTEVAAALEREGASQMTESLAEALRIDAGRPRFGVDMTEETIPLEAGLLERAISTTKGCYVGQEVIVRVLHRGAGRVAKRLVTLSFDPLPAVGSVALRETRYAGESVNRDVNWPGPGTALSADGRETGKVTSAASSPQDGHPIALGYVHRDVAEVGRRVTATVSSGQASATITGFAG